MTEYRTAAKDATDLVFEVYQNKVIAKTLLIPEFG
jgi:hypothetical protein